MPINKKNWFSLETMNRKREAIKDIIFDLQKKKNALEKNKSSSVKEKTKRLNETKPDEKAYDSSYLNDASNDSKHANASS